MRFARKMLSALGLRKEKVFRRIQYTADDFAVRSKNIGFLDEPAFAQAWHFAEARNKEGWKGNVPDIRWRAHTCCFAASHGLNLTGDFVECGVHTGILSATICAYLDFVRVPKKFFLFDTYCGIPAPDDAQEKEKAEARNKAIYFDCYDIVRETFKPFPNVEIIKGMLPGTLKDVKLDKIAYLSIDLNNATYERQVIEELWDRLSPSAMVVIDDYAFAGFEDQYEMWNGFAAAQHRRILTLPTGQGLLVK